MYKILGCCSSGFLFLSSRRVTALFSGPFLLLRGLLSPPTTLRPREQWSLCLPACRLHPLLHSASFSGLLTAAVQLSFYAPLTGVFWSQTVSEKRVYLHKQCHVRRAAGNKIKIHSSKSSWSTHFFSTHTSYSYHLYAKMRLRVSAVLSPLFLRPVSLNKPKKYLTFRVSLNRIQK